MSLQIGRALGRGIRRALNSAGIVLMVLTLCYMFVLVGSVNTIARNVLPAELAEQGQFGVTFPVSTPIAAALLGVALLFGFVVVLAAARAFTREPGRRSSLSVDLFTRRMGRALLSTIGANLVVSVSVVVGLALLFVPGLFLSVSFVFVLFAIAVEDARAVDALRRSWGLARGNRWQLFALVLVVGVVTGLAGATGSVIALADPVVGQTVSLGMSAAFSVVGYGILADAYVQLSGR